MATIVIEGPIEEQDIPLETTPKNEANGIEPETVTEKELKERTQAIVNPEQVDIAFPIKQLRFRREIKLKIMVLFLFFAIVTGVVCIYKFFEPDSLYFEFGETKFDVESHMLEVRYNDQTVLLGTLGQQISKDVNPYYCHNSKTEICLRWINLGSLTIKQSVFESTEIYHVTWIAWKKNQQLVDCYSFGDNYSWYGGGILPDQLWPVQHWNKSQYVPFITSSSSSLISGYGHEGYGSVQERYFLSSSGVQIIINSTNPLFVNIFNQSQICFKSMYSNPYQKSMNNQLELQYSITVDKSVSSVYKYAKSNIFPETSTPQEFLIGDVIWSLQDVIHGDCMTQTDILNFADDILSHGYNASILEIPEGFASNYGDFNFDRERFPNASEMFEGLHRKGWKVMLVTGIFANTDANAFIEGISQGYWVQDPRGEVPGLVQWDYGIGALLDVTYDNAITWFVNRLNNFRRKYNIDYFTFKYGQASYLPFGFKTKINLANPSDFTRLYVEAITQVDGCLAVTSGYQNQNLGLYSQFEPLHPTWLPLKGLKSVIPTVLNLSILNYHYFIPSTIGGTINVAENCSHIDIEYSVDPELYIRWVEMQVFFPVMKFSVPPWKLSDSVDNIAKKWVKFHGNYFKNKNVQQLDSFEEALIKPVWLSGGVKNVESDVIETSFMVGDSTVVAPILNSKENSRKVYLPEGKWSSPLSSELFQGGQTITITGINTDSIAYFELIDDELHK